MLKATIPGLVELDSDKNLSYVRPFGQYLNSSRAEVKKSINPFDDEYHALCEKVLNEGIESSDRTGVGTLSLFGQHLKFNLRKGFPLITTKKVNFNHLSNELLWLYSDKCHNVNNLPEESQFLWKPWARDNGSLGPIYGMNIRKWRCDMSEDGSECIDQLANVIQSIKDNPYSRRHVITNWRVDLLDIMSLQPCHGLVVQFYVRNDELSSQVYVRSNDIAIGAVFNIAQYALLTHIIASLTNLNVGELSYCIGDAHIYLNHVEGVKDQLTRSSFAPPQLKIINRRDSFDEYKTDDFEILNYEHHPFIKFEVAV